MGALPSNRKREDDYVKIHSFFNPFDPSYSHISKKPKLSVYSSLATPETYWAASPNLVASRIALYPDRKPGFSREIHAPVRNSRVGSFASSRNSEPTASSRETPDAKTGVFSYFSRLLNLNFNYNRARDSALRTIRCVVPGKQKEKEKEKEKEVIELNSEDEDCNDDSSGDELEILESGGRRFEGRANNLDDSHEPNVRTAEKEVRSFDSSVVTGFGFGNGKVDHTEKTGLSLLLDDDSRVPSYMTLLETTRKRDRKLADLQNDIEIEVKHFQRIQLSRPRKKEELIKKDFAEECFVPLTDEERIEVSRALANSQRRKVLVAHANSAIDITGEILQCLHPGAWLNDEVINLYLELLKEREKREPQKFLKCHFFNTFFYKKLVGGRGGGYNFQSVRRWTSQKKLGYSLLECDKIFVPIHKEVHWCLAVINKKDKKFQYLDSLGGVDKQVLNVLAKYIIDEVKDKCGKDIDVSSWNKEFVRELPAQENGFDCGVFMIKYADFYSRDIGLCFNQGHMPYFRLRTAKEILKLRAD